MASIERRKTGPVKVVLPFYAELVPGEKDELVIRLHLKIDFATDSLSEHGGREKKEEAIESMECEGFIVWRGTVKHRSVPFLGIGDN